MEHSQEKEISNHQEGVQKDLQNRPLVEVKGIQVKLESEPMENGIEQSVVMGTENTEDMEEDQGVEKVSHPTKHF